MPLGTPVFKTGVIDHSTISPKRVVADFAVQRYDKKRKQRSETQKIIGSAAVFDDFTTQRNTPTRCFPTFSASRPYCTPPADRTPTRHRHIFLTPQHQILQSTASFSSTRGNIFFIPRQHFLQPAALNISTRGNKFFSPRIKTFSVAWKYISKPWKYILVPLKYISKPLKLFYRRRQNNLLREEKKFIAGGKTICCGRKRSLQPAVEGLGVRADRHSPAGYRLLMR